MHILIKILLQVNITLKNENDNSPYFDPFYETYYVNESEASFNRLITVLSAQDPDNDELLYSLKGTHSDDFSFVSSSGQLKVARQEGLDREKVEEYVLFGKLNTFF